MNIFKRRQGVFGEAADLIQEGGWDQGPQLTGPGVCAAVAIGNVINRRYRGDKYTFYLYNATTALRDLIEEVYEPFDRPSPVSSYNDITLWNDAPKRTEGEVISILRLAEKTYGRKFK